MSTPHPGPVHVLAADDSLDEMRRYGTYMAFCGALVPASGLPPSLCPEGCDCAVFCPQCVHRLAEYAAAFAERAGGAR
ncbi:MAG: hypothetical protein ACRDSL_12005 [Pseudonocardiaceae bacterium]